MKKTLLFTAALTISGALHANTDLAHDSVRAPRSNLLLLNADGHGIAPRISHIGIVTEADMREAEHRMAMADHPVTTGAPASEDGHYRPIEAQGHEGRFVTRLRHGERAPKHKQVDHHGVRFKPTAWVWEASADSVTRATVGSVCPKSGHWVAEVPFDVPNVSRYDDVSTTCDAGKALPRVNTGDPYDDARVRWVWSGPLAEVHEAVVKAQP